MTSSRTFSAFIVSLMVGIDGGVMAWSYAAGLGFTESWPDRHFWNTLGMGLVAICSAGWLLRYWLRSSSVE